MKKQRASYGLYLVPDDESVFGVCKSVSSGTDWGGPHITVVGFASKNKNGLLLALADLKHGVKKKRWRPFRIEVQAGGGGDGMFLFQSTTLDTLSKFLRNEQYRLGKVHDSGWHVYLSEGFRPSACIPRETFWSLMMIEKDGATVTRLSETRVKFYDF
jgi:hypothetical protein